MRATPSSVLNKLAKLPLYLVVLSLFYPLLRAQYIAVFGITLVVLVLLEYIRYWLMGRFELFLLLVICAKRFLSNRRPIIRIWLTLFGGLMVSGAVLAVVCAIAGVHLSTQ